MRTARSSRPARSWHPPRSGPRPTPCCRRTRSREPGRSSSGSPGTSTRCSRPRSADTIIGRCRELGLTLQETKGLSTLLMVAGTETAASAMARSAALLYDTGEQHRLHRRPGSAGGCGARGAAGHVAGADHRALGDGGSLDRRAGTCALGSGSSCSLGPRTISPGRTGSTGRTCRRTGSCGSAPGRHLCLGGPLARAELTRIIQLLVGDGRPFEVVSRRYGRKVLIPAYESLVVKKS